MNLAWAFMPITPDELAQIIEREADGTITHASAKEVFAEMWANGMKRRKAVIELCKAEGLL